MSWLKLTKRNQIAILVVFMFSSTLLFIFSNLNHQEDGVVATKEEEFNSDLEGINISSPIKTYFDYSKVIIIDNTKVSGSGSHSNFPLLISIFDPDLHDYTQPDGDDIAFFDGSNQLDHEIELFNKTYNSTHAQLIAWVRIPSLSTSTDTEISMYYGNSTIDNFENPAGVWGDNYQGVWHLGEDSGTIAYDSTSHGYNGTHQGDPTPQTGKIGKAQFFDGDSDRIDTGKTASELGMGGSNSKTASAWVDTSEFARGGIFDIGSWSEGEEFCLRTSNSIVNEWRVQLWGFDFDFTYDSLNKWVYFTLSYDGTTVRVYADGVERGSNTVTLNTTDNVAFRMGQYYTGGNFNGKIDEMRVSNTSRSADWIETEYNNQNNPDNFYTIVSEKFLLHFEETDRAVDSSGNEPDGEFGEGETQNTYTLGSPTSYSEGIIGNCLDFNANNEDIVTWNDGLGDEGLMWFSGIDEFSVVGWLKPGTLSDAETNHNTENCFMSKGADDGRDIFELGIEKDANGIGVHYLHLYLDTEDGNTMRCFGSDTVNIKEDKWNFIAVTYNEGDIDVYIYNEDGEEWYDEGYKHDDLGSGTDDPWDVDHTNDALRDGDSPFSIGGTHHINTYYDGLIDEVSMYSIGLSQETIENNLDRDKPSSFLWFTPEHNNGTMDFVTNNTQFTITYNDGSGSGVALTQYRIDSGSWTEYTSAFNLTGYSEGTHTIYFNSTDNMGNVETINSAVVYLDRDNPTTSINFVSDFTTDYVNGSTLFTLTFEDGNSSGNFTTEYKIEDGSWTPYTGPFNLSSYGDNNYTIYFNSTDNVGNVEFTNSKVVHLYNETTPPNTFLWFTLEYNNGTTDFVLNSTQFIITYNDGSGAGVVSTQYRIDSGSWTEYSGVFNLTGYSEGMHTIYFNSTDNVGNVETINSTEVYLDQVAPNSYLWFSSEYNNGTTDFVSNSTQFTMTYNDGSGSGVTFTQYRVDSGSWTNYEGAFNLTGYSEGIHTIYFNSTDNAGILESINSTQIYLDRDTPTTSLYFTSDFTTDYVNGSTLFTLTFDDGTGSGNFTIDYKIDDGSWTTYTGPFNLSSQGDGSHTIHFKSTDNIGNNETTNSKVVYLYAGTTAPTTSLDFTPAYDNGTVYANVSTEFTLNSIDGSGSGVIITRYRIVGLTSWLNYTDTFNLSTYSESSYDIEYYSTDRVGNNESVGSTTVYFDKNDTSTFLWFTAPYNNGIMDFVTNNTQFTITYNDGSGSGVALTQYRIDSGSWTNYTGAFNLTGYSNGLHTIEFNSTDNVGNVETIYSTDVYLDREDPNSFLWFTAPYNNGTMNFVLNTTQFTMTFNDGSGTGVALTQYRIDTDPWTNYTGAFNLIGYSEGLHIIYFNSTDIVGNVEEINSTVIYLDLNLPNTLLWFMSEYNNGTTDFVSNSTQFTLTYNDDSGSGVALTQYRIDSGSWTNYTGVFNLTGYSEGTHTIYFNSTDNVGNVEVINSSVVYLDRDEPNTFLWFTPEYSTSADFVINNTQFSITYNDGSGSGVVLTQYRIDSGSWTNYTGAFNLTGYSEGNHTIYFNSTDNVGNIEAINSTEVYLDSYASNSFLWFTPEYTDGTDFITNTTEFTITANDGLGSGVATRSYRINDSSWFSYTDTPFTFSGYSEGWYRIYFNSTDNVGNREMINSTLMYLDIEYANTTLVFTPAYSTFFVTPSTLITINANDYSGSGVPAGSVEYQIDGGSWQIYTVGFYLTGTNGFRSISTRSTDNVGNVEPEKEQPFLFLDSNLPNSSIDYSIAYPSTPNYVNSSTTFEITCEDPAPSSGIDESYYQITDQYQLSSGGSWISYSTPFNLSAYSDAIYWIHYRSIDNVGNGETPDYLEIELDSTAPTTGIDYTLAYGYNYINASTTFTISANDGSGSGTGVRYYQLDSTVGTWIQYSSPFDISSSSYGNHTLYYYSIDNAGNPGEILNISLYLDKNDPITTLSFDSVYTPGYVNSTTEFTLSATDNLESGVKNTRYQIDGGSWTTWLGTPFTLNGEGMHWICYNSTDNVGNVEVLHNKTVYLYDETDPPTTSISYVPFQTLFVNTTTLFTLIPVDGTGSGINATMYRIINETYYTFLPWTEYTAPFNLAGFPEGNYTIYYYSIDNVGNNETTVKEETVELNYTPDYDAPETFIDFSVVYGPNFVLNTTEFSFIATDINGTGVKNTYYQIDSNLVPWTTYTTPFNLSGIPEGSHIIYYYSIDNVGNIEAINSTTVYLDINLPTTSIDYVAAYGSNYVNISSLFSISANDGSGSGIAARYYQLDGTGGTWTIYTTAFNISLSSDGHHDIYFYSMDNVGQNSSIDSITVNLDKTASSSSINYFIAYPGIPNFVNGSTEFNITGSDIGGSGVALIQFRIDGGSWTTYTIPFNISSTTEGNHTISFYSRDNVGNVEEFINISVYHDKTNPITDLLFTSVFADDYVNTTTEFSLSAGDSLGSGINITKYQIDGGTWTSYISTFTLSAYSEGMHWICYNSTDNVGNVEALHNKTVYLYDETDAPTTNWNIIDSFILTATFINLTSDDGSGGGVYHTYYRIDGGNWIKYIIPFTLFNYSTGQSHTIEYYSIDNMGNNETIKTHSIDLYSSPDDIPKDDGESGGGGGGDGGSDGGSSDDSAAIPIIIGIIMACGIVGGLAVFIKKKNSESVNFLPPSVSHVKEGINKIMTAFFDYTEHWYYSGPRIYLDRQKRADGLIVNYGTFIQNRLAAIDGLADFMNLDLKNIYHIKAIQFFYVTDLSDENIRKICLEFQTSDILTIIVGIEWPKFQYDNLIEVAIDDELPYGYNCKIVNPELFIDLTGLKGKAKIAFEKIIEWNEAGNYPALSKFNLNHHNQKVVIHDSEDLKNDLIEKGFINQTFEEYFDVW